MKQEGNKKIAFLMAVVMLLGLLTPIPCSVTETAAATKASIRSYRSYSYDYVEGGAYNYDVIYLDNMKKTATYSIEISNEKVAEYTGQPRDGFEIRLKKAGTFTVTVKETYKNKVTKVGSQKCTVKSSTDYDYNNSVTMGNGTSFSVRLLGIAGTFTAETEDSDIAVVEEKSGHQVLTAKSVGTTEIVFTYDSNGYTQTKTMTVNVVDPSEISTSASSSLASQIKKYCTTTVTKSNALTVLKKAKSLKTKLTAAIEEDSDRNLTIGVSTVYDLNDLEAVITKCKLKLGLSFCSCGVSLEAVKLTKITGNKVTLKLDHAVTSAEYAALDDPSTYYVVIEDADGNCYRYSGKVKKGATTITAKLLERYGDSIPTGTYRAWVPGTNDNEIKTIKITYK